MKVYKITSTRPISSAILEGQSQAADGRTWTLFMDGSLIYEPCPTERLQDIWNFKVNRAKRNDKDQLVPFEMINVPEEAVDYHTDDDKLHAIKMQNLIRFIKNHYSVAIYETNSITGEKEQINKSLKAGALCFVLEDISKKETEEFYIQKTKNKARLILDNIFDLCHTNSDKAQLVNLAYGVGVEEPFRKSEIQLYNGILFKLDQDVKFFLEFVSNTDQEYILAITKGLIGVSDIEKPCITQDPEKRMFLGDVYLGQSTQEAVAYIKGNPAVYDYLKTKIHENSSLTGKKDKVEVKSIAKEAIKNLEEGLESNKEVDDSISKTAIINDIQQDKIELLRECKSWIKNFKQATGDPVKMMKVSENFDSYFRLNVKNKPLDFLQSMKDMATEAAVVIEILPVTFDYAKEQSLATA